MIKHVFLVVIFFKFFFEMGLYNRNDSPLYMSDLHCWLSGQSEWEIAISDPNGVLLL